MAHIDHSALSFLHLLSWCWAHSLWGNIAILARASVISMPPFILWKRSMASYLERDNHSSSSSSSHVIRAVPLGRKAKAATG